MLRPTCIVDKRSVAAPTRLESAPSVSALRACSRAAIASAVSARCASAASRAAAVAALASAAALDATSLRCASASSARAWRSCSAQQKGDTQKQCGGRA
eukprot:366284-Chlamydomonas_euryale.AAC.5